VVEKTGRRLGKEIHPKSHACTYIYVYLSNTHRIARRYSILQAYHQGPTNTRARSGLKPDNDCNPVISPERHLVQSQQADADTVDERPQCRQMFRGLRRPQPTRRRLNGWLTRTSFIFARRTMAEEWTSMARRTEADAVGMGSLGSYLRPGSLHLRSERMVHPNRSCCFISPLTLERLPAEAGDFQHGVPLYPSLKTGQHYGIETKSSLGLR
jgi:hypothetical protein